MGTKDNVADILTKSTTRTTLEDITLKIMSVGMEKDQEELTEDSKRTILNVVYLPVFPDSMLTSQ